MSRLDVHGIKSCDTCRKALKWLDDQGREYRWHDLRADGLDLADLENWLASVGVDALVNRRSTTWRSLDEAQRTAAADPAQAAATLLAHPTLIKRPVFVTDAEVLVGFDAGVRDKL